MDFFIGSISFYNESNIFFKGTYMKKISYMGHRYNSIKLGGLRYIHPILISWCPDEK